MFKKVFAVFIALMLCFSLCGCGYEYAELDLVSSYTKELAGTDLMFITGANTFLTAVMTA